MGEKKPTTARSVLWPSDTNILVRVAILYVGQGSCAIVFAASGNSYKVVLIDINLDSGAGGIDVPKLMKDLLDGEALHAFVNTHPHDDHLRGVEDLSDTVTINNVWHSGHIPSKKYGASYDNLKRVIAKVKKANGDDAEVILEGSRSAKTLGDAAYYVLGPAEHVTDDVNEDEADARYARIHEQCAVLKFGKGKQWIMIAGDADRKAFEDHITDYHKERLGAFALAGSHHGSRTFFRETDDEDDEPYLDALKAINPTYVVISAPKQSESKHEHPHDDAVELYEDHVGSKNVLHTGADRKCFIFDIFKDGTVSGILDDGGKLAKEYGLSDGDDDGGGDKTESKASGGFRPPEAPATPGGGRWG
jgi:beta-lactamase superfamily II metal-dependent hydrolase